MIERRDKIGRYWFERMNPLDKFRFEKSPAGEITLAFSDLAVDSKLANANETQYIYTISYNKKGRHRQSVVTAPAIPISKNGNGFLDEILADNNIKKPEDKIFSVKIQTQRKGNDLSKGVEVYFYYPNYNGTPRVAGIVREE
jgi:hypothetical protein